MSSLETTLLELSSVAICMAICAGVCAGVCVRTMSAQDMFSFFCNVVSSRYLSGTVPLRFDCSIPTGYDGLLPG